MSGFYVGVRDAKGEKSFYQVSDIACHEAAAAAVRDSVAGARAVLVSVPTKAKAPATTEEAA